MPRNEKRKTDERKNTVAAKLENYAAEKTKIKKGTLVQQVHEALHVAKEVNPLNVNEAEKGAYCVSAKKACLVYGNSNGLMV